MYNFFDISELKFNTWLNLENKFSDNLDVSELVQFAHAKVEYGLLHKECNQALGKESKRFAENKIRELKKEYSPKEIQNSIYFPEYLGLI